MDDLLIRGGTVADGTGAPLRAADVAVKGGVITSVGKAKGGAKREIDATGLLVTPGFVDVHTHYDGQVTWDAFLSPSCWHGVTTAVFGNCGVGFAPVRPGSVGSLINLMQGVEDIPEIVLSEGVKFDWQTFPEYMSSIDRSPHAIDVGTQVPHAALRYFVMGERGMDHLAVPTDEEIATMGRHLEESLEAGALGFTSSRTFRHMTADGRSVPSLSARESEWLGIAAAMRRCNKGVIEVNSDLGPGDFDFLREMAKASGRPLSLLVMQTGANPEKWRETLGLIEDARAAGLEVTSQVGCRAIGVLMGLETTMNPFSFHPRWKEIAALTPKQRYERLRDDEALRNALVDGPLDAGALARIIDNLPRSYVLDAELDYEPDPTRQLGEIARGSGRSIRQVALDAMMQGGGKGLLLLPYENYHHGNLDAVREMLMHPASIVGLSDAGAHVGVICDASAPTLLLTLWTRDRTRGPRLPLEFAVHKQTQATAWAFGMRDRGVLAPGYKADINVIDYQALQLAPPQVRYDLPAGGRRIMQRARGYMHTFVSGVETISQDELTGALPGRLVRGARGPQPVPLPA